MKPKLVLVDEGMFCVGMRLRAKIYYRYKGNDVLLCKNVVFTEALLKKLQTIAKAHGGIYIEADSYAEVWNERLRRYSIDAATYKKMFHKVRRDYVGIISKTTGLLRSVSLDGRVSLPAADILVDNVCSNITQNDQSVVLRCVNLLGKADDYLYSHSVNVAALNGMMGRWMELPEEQIRQLIKIGLLHDLGKLKVPPEILNKPGRLTAREFEEIKKHPVYSHEILLQSGETDPDVIAAVRQHHEKPNGTGYPDGLKQGDISLMAKITSVSDVYDAMVSKRCYKEPSTPFEILAQFKENRFSDLDLHVVNTFLDHITYLFVGMRVKLSNDAEAEVLFVPPGDVANPLVKVGDHVVATSDDCKCVSVESYL